jgi:Zn-dependent peptidase ImmA (M78 family)
MKTKIKAKTNYRHKVRQVFDAVRQKYNIPGKLADVDFYRICDAENIELFNNEDSRQDLLKLETTGFYLHSKGVKFIYLRSFFGRKLNLNTAMHELGHHFLGHLGTEFKSKKSVAQKEKEANYFARLAAKTEVSK